MGVGARRTMGWVILGLWPALMVCGQSLHDLFAIHHGMGSCHGRACPPNCPESALPIHDGFCASEGPSDLIEEADCPICQFFATVQPLPVVAAVVLPLPLLQATGIGLGDSAAPAVVLLGYYERGPPAPIL